MGIFHKHIPAMKRLEERVESQELKLSQSHQKAETILNQVKKLESFILKNFGQKQGEQILAQMSSELAYINQRISINEFDEASALLNKIDARIKSQAMSQAGVAYT